MVLNVDFMTLNILKLDSFSFSFLHVPCIYFNLRAPLQNFVREIQFDTNLSYLKQILGIYMFNTPTCTLFLKSSNICRLFLEFVLST